MDKIAQWQASFGVRQMYKNFGEKEKIKLKACGV
jgi:hypothetical protein